MAVNPKIVIVVCYRDTGDGIEFLGISHDIGEPEILRETASSWLQTPASTTVFVLTRPERGLIGKQTTKLEEAIRYLQD